MAAKDYVEIYHTDSQVEATRIADVVLRAQGVETVVHDRTDLTSTELEALKDDLLKAISRYIEIDADAVQIGVERDGRSQRLVADIPLKNVTRQRAG